MAAQDSWDGFLLVAVKMRMCCEVGDVGMEQSLFYRVLDANALGKGTA